MGTLRAYFSLLSGSTILLGTIPQQGPKLTFLGRRQPATEIFFQSPYGKMWSPKSVNKIFPSQRNTNQTFWSPDGNFWSPIFLLRIRTKKTRLGPQ